MKIHTSLGYTTVQRVGATDERLRDVITSIEESGSRTHRHAYHLTLRGSYPVSSVNGAKRRRANSGHYGAAGHPSAPEYAATFDEWGYWLAALYELDPAARCGGTITHPVYADRADFHNRTNNAYKPKSEGN